MKLRSWAALLLFIGFLAAVQLFSPRWYVQHEPANAVLSETVLQPREVEGSVRDNRGPVMGARIRYQAEAASVLSDTNGYFRLPPARQNVRRVTAWKEGYLIAGAALEQRPLVLTLTPLPAEDAVDYHWIDPSPHDAQRQNCGNCHDEIYREWSASGHARSIRNRRFLNLYDGSDWQGRPGVGWNLLAEHPHGAGVCTACHAPTVPFADAAYFDLRQARGTALRGVHCDYCHKIAEVTNDRIGLTHGRFGLQLLRPATGQLFFGPLDDVDRGEETFSALYRDSRYCASCHEGTVFGVPVYSTYSEWLESRARQHGKQCQSCHMAPSGTLSNIAPGRGGIPRDPATLANHRFFAGSQAEMLRRCLHVSVELTAGNNLRGEVEVQAGDVGHRVPTGFVDRNLVLVLEALDVAGERLPARSGPALPPLVGPQLAGLPGRLYAKQLTDFEGHAPVPFWRARPEVTDTRLSPDRPDRTVFEFPAETVRVSLRLLYRRFWPQVAEAKGWPDDEIRIVDEVLEIRPGERRRWSFQHH
jgi:hypothetical protein